ncbi:Exodeoxyribonuclease VII large subunit [Luteibacter sp. UNCMF331Sha3.1]|uniref:exodeoxyribonuclease VII large subunit n=1 Tax=Luteibacter sp. UNCMF331Sha3.1 TaxID=1502760 RepID=UPI0008D72203|nr:exodeoxyribonuclease VII large subunit [Luteibacter sp. UNCMF331Sha3.1]SEM23751.1 Exodeoxyribonuclease VII large subunit [Luteibacter sp. UNCMF331Sha3.1]
MSASDESARREIFTPSGLNRLVRDLLEDALPMGVWIEGELSNVARPASGHVYFTLKDASAQVRCAMFRTAASRLRFRPTDGMHVLMRAKVGLYEARGEFQLVADHMEPAGEGALQREFEQLKARLGAEGLFDADRKRELPAFPARIGVVTSPSGAAVRDVISVLGRRCPLAEVEILPVPVQGREAPPLIAAMLRSASASGRYDVLLVTRGGGSLEDLWAFNDEAVARAIHASAVPVVSAVGHEVDFTIADFVADLRAATPSAAAELLVPDRNDLERRLDRLRQRMATVMSRRLQAAAQRADQAQTRLNAQRPQARLARDAQRLASLRRRLELSIDQSNRLRRASLDRLQARLGAHHPRLRLTPSHLRLAELRKRLADGMARRIERDRARLAQQARTMHAVSPLATLERGYAIVFDQRDAVVRRATDVAVGDRLRVMLGEGEIRVRRED